MNEVQAPQPEVLSSVNNAAPARRSALTAHQQKVLSTLGVLALGMAVGLVAHATGVNANGVIGKFDTFCSTWIKPIYLAVLACIVLVVCYKGFIEIINEDGQGGRKIGMALIGGAAGVLVPGAILTAIAATTAFNC
jgi:hypothetical protein